MHILKIIYTHNMYIICIMCMYTIHCENEAVKAEYKHNDLQTCRAQLGKNMFEPLAS